MGNTGEPADRHRGGLLKGTVWAFAARVVSAGAVFLLNVVIARRLGASDAGLFYLGLSVVVVAGVIARFGLDRAVVRFVAAHASRDEWGSVAAIYRRFVSLSTCSALVIAALLYGSSDWLSRVVFGKPALQAVLQVLSIALVPLVVVILHSQFLQGLKRAALGLFAQTAMVQSLLLVLLLLAGSGWSLSDLTAYYAGAAVVAAALLIAAWWRAGGMSASASVDYDFKPLTRSSRTLFPAAVMDQIVQPWAAIVALGIWADVAEVGLFVAANRLAALVGVAILPVNTILAPRLSALAVEGDYAGARRLARSAMMLMTVIAIPLVFPLVFATDRIMTLFGSEFAAGGTLLLILVLGQAINVVTGPARASLIMTGNEHLYRRASVIGGIVVLAGCALLARDYGGAGAAWATTAGLVSTKVTAAIMARWRFSELTQGAK